MNVWVVMGGSSAEREVSLASGRAVAQALLGAGHGVTAYEMRDGVFLPELSTPGTARAAAPVPEGTAWAEKLLATARRLRGRCDVAFLALHGDEGEDGTVQALLEAVGFPYTGSGPGACAISMDKVLTKRVMESLGIATPPWALVAAPGIAAGVPRVEVLGGTPVGGLPVVVKPVSEGSSVGISIVRRPEEWGPALIRAADAPGRNRGFRRQILVESYVEGREITVGIVGERVLPVLEIIPRTGFYDFERKYTAGESQYEVPARIPPEASDIAQRDAWQLFASLGCRGVARIDFRLDLSGRPSCMELNAIPGLTSTSLVPKAALEVGIDFAALLELICSEGIAKTRLTTP
jgi:D-alanine-D-alanine ligase